MVERTVIKPQTFLDSPLVLNVLNNILYIESYKKQKTGLYKIDLPDGEYLIRKLTPLECERLQTLPDNYTAGVSNTQRYKAIGNGWTVDVIAWIFSQLSKGE